MWVKINGDFVMQKGEPKKFADEHTAKRWLKK